MFVLFVGYGSASLLKDQITSIESRLEFREQTLYTFIQDKDLLAEIEPLCSTESRKKGNLYGKKLSELVDTRYQKMSDAAMLLDSLDLRNRVHAMHMRMPQGMSDDELCMRKIISYHLQKQFRKRHIDLIYQKGLLDDFNVPNPPLREVGLKKEVLEELIQKSSHIVGPEIVVSIQNPEFLSTLNDDERSLAELSRKVMEQSLREVFALFLEKGWFNSVDMDKLYNLIVLEYTTDCGSVAGKYEVVYQAGKEGQKNNLKTTKLQLTVSTCTKIGFVLQKSWLSKLIAIHEFGHHVWWYKDTNPEQFTQLCWGVDGMRNDRCVDRDFVSEYAKSSPEEDYAEHFQQWVMQRRSRPGFIDTKIRYFDTLFSY